MQQTSIKKDWQSTSQEEYTNAKQDLETRHFKVQYRLQELELRGQHSTREEIGN